MIYYDKSVLNPKSSFELLCKKIDESTKVLIATAEIKDGQIVNRWLNPTVQIVGGKVVVGHLQ